MSHFHSSESNLTKKLKSVDNRGPQTYAAAFSTLYHAVTEDSQIWLGPRTCLLHLLRKVSRSVEPARPLAIAARKPGTSRNQRLLPIWAGARFKRRRAEALSVRRKEQGAEAFSVDRENTENIHKST
jgi:hypothetical protein